MAASATVGRPLRRALGKLLYAEKTYTDVPVIRPEENNESVVDSVEGGVSRARSVGIPTTIKHMVMMHDGESDQLSSKLAAGLTVSTLPPLNCS